MKDNLINGVWIYSETTLPTLHGTFKVYVFRNDYDDKENLAIVAGEIGNGEAIPVRMHSECLTSEVLGSLKCDCREQLNVALKYIAEQGRGIVLYLRQEGRGIGLGNKIRAYALQENGFDTVEANHLLGFPDDMRNYNIAASMLKILGVKSVQLLTNNPNKINSLKEYEIPVINRIPLEIEPNHINKFYLQTKAEKSGHLLELNGKTNDSSILNKLAS
jgi:GTP cyclohydrolase II/3,4-dihydroxy 2-butanone 4-phosphate synthase/GTP cyclohydrolase II